MSEREIPTPIASPVTPTPGLTIGDDFWPKQPAASADVALPARIVERRDFPGKVYVRDGNVSGGAEGRP